MRSSSTSLPAPSIAAIKRAPDASEQIADALMDHVVGNRLGSGAMLPSERELAERFGVSRTVIRQAIRALIGKGLLEVRPGVGISVAPAATSPVVTSMSLYLRRRAVPYEWVHEIRMTIELRVATLAAERGTSEQVERLRAIHADLAARTERNDYEGRSVADVEFHRQLAAMAQNELYPLLLDSLGEIMLEIRRATAARQEATRSAVGEHLNILERVAARDADGARAAMRAHLERAYEEWLRLGSPVSLPE